MSSLSHASVSPDESPVPDPAPLEELRIDNPETFNPTQIHGYLQTAYRLGEHLKLLFCRALLILHEARIYLALDYSSTSQYAEINFTHNPDRQALDRVRRSAVGRSTRDRLSVP